MDEYEFYESECKKIRKENHKTLDSFEQYLYEKKLSKKTIDKHVSNVDFYINEFLLYEEPLKAKEGLYHLDHFLGYWFIRKAMWASVTSIKENITSFKHFYTFMHACKKIGLKELNALKDEIKKNKIEWLEAIRKFDNPDIDLEDIW